MLAADMGVVNETTWHVVNNQFIQDYRKQSLVIVELAFRPRPRQPKFPSLKYRCLNIDFSRACFVKWLATSNGIFYLTLICSLLLPLSVLFVVMKWRARSIFRFHKFIRSIHFSIWFSDILGSSNHTCSLLLSFYVPCCYGLTAFHEDRSRWVNKRKEPRITTAILLFTRGSVPYQSIYRRWASIKPRYKVYEQIRKAFMS